MVKLYWQPYSVSVGKAWICVNEEPQNAPTPTFNDAARPKNQGNSDKKIFA